MATQVGRMKNRLHRTALTLFLALTTGCSMTHGTPDKPANNPHPVKRYEITATSEAPGPWDSIEGYIGYDIVKGDNGIVKCVPMDSFLGEQSLTSIGLDIAMTRVNDHTWRGYFYRDALQDEDYYNLGVCHWDVTSVGVSAVAQGIRFNWGIGFEPQQHGGFETSYFKKSSYADRKLVGIGALDYSDINPEYVKRPNEFFPVTIAVKEIAP
jgi:hypothetical protein